MVEDSYSKNQTFAATNDHVCEKKVISEGSMIDVKSEMREMVVNLALKDLAKTPGAIFDEVTAHFNSKMAEKGKPAYESLTRNAILSLVNNTRYQKTGGDVFRAIEGSPCATLPESDMHFLRFNVTREREGMVKINPF